MLGILFSGGKDSAFTAYYYAEQGWDLKCLITMKSANRHSWMFHTPTIELAKLQADAMGLPLIEAETKGYKEEELKDLETALETAKKSYGIRAVAVGALLSDYQQERVNRVCYSLGLKCFAPLWHKDQERLLREVISLGFDVRIAAIAAQGLGESVLGAKVDEKLVARFAGLNRKNGFHVGGEGGEYESLVLDAPFFGKRIELLEARKIMENECTGRLEVLGAGLVAKQESGKKLKGRAPYTGYG